MFAQTIQLSAVVRAQPAISPAKTAFNVSTFFAAFLRPELWKDAEITPD